MRNPLNLTGKSDHFLFQHSEREVVTLFHEFLSALKNCRLSVLFQRWIFNQSLNPTAQAKNTGCPLMIPTIRSVLKFRSSLMPGSNDAGYFRAPHWLAYALA
ncbi:hypothetical protein U14_03967 [Candidatus Moduliflexus flocculans]|uniref:Uncharacterized protein n=1 Tax=Candidatus Moduliflexus flocculans TaxID=1499966 RepID=A0A0S6VZK6_9BACT|nr:hypothetical protein U14_03967 [Candidatus Moduliflexus flocculans]